MYGQGAILRERNSEVGRDSVENFILSALQNYERSTGKAVRMGGSSSLGFARLEDRDDGGIAWSNLSVEKIG